MVFSRLISAFIFFVSVSLFCPCNASAQAEAAQMPPKHEVRAVWLTTIGGLDWPRSYAQSPASVAKQKAELTAILDQLCHAGINTVLFQTRIRGTVIYPSAIEPWDGCCSGSPGRSPGYDPLEFAIKECHRRGMEIQAWIVAIPAGKWNGLGCKTLRRKHPQMMKRIGSDGFIDPQSPQAAPYIASICREITERYDIDGIHLDYIRYPETWNVKPSMRDAARRNITAIVRKARNEVKALKPWVKLSCSPIGKHADLNRYSSRGWNAFDKGCQPAQRWLSEGIMDQLYPMMYFRGDNFYPFVMDWIENAAGRTVAPGLGAYLLSPREADWPPEDIQRELSLLRTLKTGFALFRAKFFIDDTKGIYRFAANQICNYATLVPPMTWACRTAPEAPQNISIARSAGTETLTWTAPRHIQDGGILYNVYASPTFPVDINDPRNLIAVRLDRQEASLKPSAAMNYAVTAVNRYGIESRPAATRGKAKQSKPTGFIHNDGHSMTLPPKSGAVNADFILIENMRGQVVMSVPWNGRITDISRLKNGLYKVKTVNRRNIIHSYGVLLVNREETNLSEL